jgi:hypothetical protein
VFFSFFAVTFCGLESFGIHPQKKKSFFCCWKNLHQKTEKKLSPKIRPTIITDVHPL